MIVSEVKRIHSLPRHQDYGSPRMHRELVSQGVECSENTVAKLMRENQIQARSKPKFRISTTDSNHDLPIAPNRLGQQFTVSKINQVWLTDFTYIPTSDGFSYLCAFKDLCSRRDCWLGDEPKNRRTTCHHGAQSGHRFKRAASRFDRPFRSRVAVRQQRVSQAT